MTNAHAVELGRLGGRSKSEKKIKAARINIAKATAARMKAKKVKNNP